MNRILLLFVALFATFNPQISAAAAYESQAKTFQITYHTSEELDNTKEYIMGCDVGRTEIVIGIFEIIDKKPVLKIECTTETKHITNFTDHITSFCEWLKGPVVSVFTPSENVANQIDGITVKRACFASSGVPNATNDYVQPVHVSFNIDCRAIEQRAGIESARVINDFEVIGLGIQAIDQKHIITLHEGMPREKGTKAIIGVGNGVGSGQMVWDAAHNCYKPATLNYSCVDFSPHTMLELKLSMLLQAEKGSRSWGKVLGSTGGIISIYNLLSEENAYTTPTATFNHYLEVFANCFEDQRCKDAVDMYMVLYARLIRNLALAQLPHGGVYITNLIAEKNPELFTVPSFIEELHKTENDYLYDILVQIPIYMVTHPGLQTYGAALYATLYMQDTAQ